MEALQCTIHCSLYALRQTDAAERGARLVRANCEIAVLVAVGRFGIRYGDHPAFRPLGCDLGDDEPLVWNEVEYEFDFPEGLLFPFDSSNA